MKKKLTLNKERVTKLTAEQSSAIQGGLRAEGSVRSTNHGFTCCMCTGGDDHTYNSFDVCPPNTGTDPDDPMTPTYQSAQNTTIC